MSFEYGVLSAQQGDARDEHLWDVWGINARRADPPLVPPYEGGEDVVRRPVRAVSIYEISQ